MWDRHDPFFASEGAEAFRRDLPAARIVLLETGHFAVETDGGKVADEIRNFFLDYLEGLAQACANEVGTSSERRHCAPAKGQ